MHSANGTLLRNGYANYQGRYWKIPTNSPISVDPVPTIREDVSYPRTRADRQRRVGFAKCAANLVKPKDKNLRLRQTDLNPRQECHYSENRQRQGLPKDRRC